MQVGDLVELSAQGQKLLWLKPLKGMRGIVMKNWHNMRWQVKWFGKSKTGRDVSRWHSVDHRSLKQFKAKKLLYKED